MASLARPVVLLFGAKSPNKLLDSVPAEISGINELFSST
jgi:hypothetical protein